SSSILASNWMYGFAEIAGSSAQENTGLPLNSQVNLLMILRAIGLPCASLRWPDSIRCETSVLIWMISPFLASFGSLIRGLSAMFSLLSQPPQPPMVTLTVLRSVNSETVKVTIGGCGG